MSSSEGTWQVKVPPRRGFGPCGDNTDLVKASRSEVTLDNVLAFYDEAGQIVRAFNKEQWDSVERYA